MSNILSRLFNSSSDELYWKLQLVLSLLVGVTFVVGFWTVRVGLRANRRAKSELAATNERAAKLEKEAADARLELAKIDPLNLPIRSVRADVWLSVRADFVDWYFKPNDPVLKGGARTVSVWISGKGGALLTLRCNEYESSLLVVKGPQPDGRTFAMSFVWPAADWMATQDVAQFWVDRNNATTAMLDKEMLGVVISLPPTKDANEPAEIVQSSCTLTINGSIRRNFSVPKSAKTVSIFCPVKTD